MSTVNSRRKHAIQTLQFCIEELEAENMKLMTSDIRSVQSELHSLNKIKQLETEKRRLNTRCSELWDWTKELKAEKAELVDIIQRFVNWDIRLSEPVTEGIDRDIIEDAQAALAKAEPTNPKPEEQ